MPEFTNTTLSVFAISLLEKKGGRAFGLTTAYRPGGQRLAQTDGFCPDVQIPVNFSIVIPISPRPTAGLLGFSWPQKETRGRAGGPGPETGPQFGGLQQKSVVEIGVKSSFS